MSTATLYNWRKQARARGQILPSRSIQPNPTSGPARRSSRSSWRRPR
ncbi:hypothetical protein GPM19_07065 [Halomonas sp. ZH2S]|uniref:Transposase n=1 Tax=Vreelandella zhuhanensis TaxID=2684210 RepID=A0A7X3GZW6_9GAMM|nr:hypothetical protein [Halomonas zhuhanensis]